MAELIVRVHETVASYIANAEDKSLATDIGNEVLQLSRAVVKHHTFPEQQRYQYYLAQPSRTLCIGQIEASTCPPPPGNSPGI